MKFKNYKMKSIKFMIILFCSLVLFSCGNKNNTTQNGSEINIDEVINSSSNDPNAKGENKCLLDFQSKYDALISETDVLAATGFSKEVMKTKYNKIFDDLGSHEFLYLFDNKRKQFLKQLNRKIEMDDVVAVRNIKPMSLSTFNQTYRAITEAEINQAKDAMKDISEGNSGDANADKAMKKAEQLAVSKEEVNKVGSEIIDGFKSVTEAYEKVDGLGDAAVWNTQTQELIVLQKGVQFEIRVNINDDNEVNKTTAIQLAKIVVEKCK